MCISLRLLSLDPLAFSFLTDGDSISQGIGTFFGFEFVCDRFWSLSRANAGIFTEVFFLLDVLLDFLLDLALRGFDC